MKNCPNCQSEIPEGYEVCWKCGYNFQSAKVEPFVELDKNQVEFSRDIKCLRCGTPMAFQKKLHLKEGFDWGLFGDLGHLFTNSTSFEMYICPDCGKVELFT